MFKDVLCLHHSEIICWVNRRVLLWALLRTASWPESLATTPSSWTVNHSPFTTTEKQFQLLSQIDSFLSAEDYINLIGCKNFQPIEWHPNQRSLVTDIYYRGDTETFQPWINSIYLYFSLLLNLCIVTFPNLTFRWPGMVIILIIKPTICTNFSNLFFGIKLYMFWTVPLSIIRSFSLYTQQWYMSYKYKYAMIYQSNKTKLHYVYHSISATCFDSYRIIFRPF